MSSDFRIGSIVKTRNDDFALSPIGKGKIGKVISFNGNKPDSVGVEFVKKLDLGHDCSGRGKKGYCWNGNTKELILIDNPSGSMNKKGKNKMKINFKVGERVVVVNNKSRHNLQFGNTVVIKRIESGITPIRIHASNGFYFYEEDLSKLKKGSFFPWKKGMTVKNTDKHSKRFGQLCVVEKVSKANGSVRTKYKTGEEEVTFNPWADYSAGENVTTKYDLSHLDSLVISSDVKTEIKAVLEQHKHSKKLFTEWGLGETIEYGKGMTFLFWGQPGTGKTWGAHCIAKALGKEIMTIGAGEIQSSEPGAADRNIQAAFHEAKTTGKVLLIDECDSLIFDRSELGMVLGSEVNTLLTEIEKFEGVLILATNRITNMDTALERRIALIVEFPLPTLPQRKKIWGKIIPSKLPLHKDVSLDELAAHNLTGGLIKNSLLQAARLAAAEGKDKVDKSHFTKAIERTLKSRNLMGQSNLQRGSNDIDVGIRKSKVNNFFKDYDRTKTTEL